MTARTGGLAVGLIALGWAGAAAAQSLPQQPARPAPHGHGVATQPGAEAGSTAHVRILHADPDLQLTRLRRWQIDRDQHHAIDILLFDPVCGAPCGRDVAAPGVYQFVRDGDLIDERFALQPGTRVEIDVTAGSEEMRVGGGSAMILGGGVVAVSALMLAARALDDVQAGVGMGIGGVAFGVGLTVHLLGHSHIDIRPTQATTAYAPGHWLGAF